MRKYIFLALILCASLPAFSQQRSTLKGAVSDTIDKKNLENTVITLMKTGDSVLVKFARADKSGRFTISGLDSGKFILMITHPYLGDYFDQVQLQPGMEKDLGMINMIPKSKLLEEVIVRSGSPIRIKGDTTIYTADSFRVRPGANVEELLRRLPGIQVDRNGQITAMGERVRKILVDGEEFFGSDPGIVAKNLRADNVKEVQVFDRLSEQAQFTGIDDGNKEKTINLKLKELKGYFGKVEAGGGLKDKFNNSIMMNNFRGKKKIAAYGVLSNTGQTNLDWQDAQNYGGGISGLQSGVADDGSISVSISNTDETSYYGGRNGIPTNWNAGLHYNNKFNSDRLSLNGGYKFSKVNSPGITRTFSETFLPDTSWSSNSINDNFSSRIRHELNMTVETMLDSSNSLRWTTRANHNLTRSDSKYYSETIAGGGDTVSTNLRNTDNDQETNSLVTTLLWRHKFKKLSRTLSINTDLNWNRNSSEGLLYSLNNYYSAGSIFDRDTVDQQNVQVSEAQGLVTRIAYTEPLAKDMYMELSHSISYNNNLNDRVTNVKSPDGKYNNRIDTLSNSFTFKRLVNTPGLNFRVNKKKYNYSFGAAVGFSRFIQDNITAKIKTKYNFVNFFPRAQFQYRLKQNEVLRFNYNGSTQAPSLEQLQPIRINTDPFNVYLGNQDLKQAFRHNISMGYNLFNTLKEKGFYVNFGINLTQNSFTQFNSVDSFNRRTYYTVNVDGVYNAYGYISYYFKIPDTRWQLSVGPTFNQSRNVDFLNDPKTNTTAKNVTTNLSYGSSLSISQRVNEKYNFYIQPSIRWVHSEATINSAANAQYWQVDGWAGGEWFVPGKSKIELRTDLNFQARKKDPRFPANNNFTTWNAHITKRLWKNAFEIDLGVFDILNQNRGYQRNFNSYTFTETYYNTLQRFWLLTFTWNFSKNGKPATF